MSDYDIKLRQVQMLRNQVASIAQIVDNKERDLKKRESILRQEQIPTVDAYAVERNLARNMGPLAPGNVGDINKVIWPYYFTTGDLGFNGNPPAPMAAGDTFQTGFSITQEAAFVLMAIMKVVYLTDEEAALPWRALNPNDEASLVDSAPGLQFTIRDGSSSRSFVNEPVEISNYGNPRFPTKLPRPMIFLPNQIVQVQFTNTHPSNFYVPKLTAFGYRIRVEDAQQILGLTYA